MTIVPDIMRIKFISKAIFECRDSFRNDFFCKISSIAVKPMPPILNKKVITILTIGSPTNLLKLSGSRPKPALLNAEMAFQKTSEWLK